MNIYIVRHSETNLNKESIYYGKTDCNINKTGISQSKKLQNFFENINIDYIISSNLKRAIQTAEIIRGEKNIKIIKNRNLQEIDFGNWENKNIEDIIKNDKENYDKLLSDWINFKFPNGESYNDFYIRIENTFKYIKNNFNNSNILIISHNGVLRCLLCIALQIDKKNFWRFNFEQGTYTLLNIVDNYSILKKYNCIT